METLHERLDTLLTLLDLAIDQGESDVRLRELIAECERCFAPTRSAVRTYRVKLYAATTKRPGERA